VRDSGAILMLLEVRIRSVVGFLKTIIVLALKRILRDMPLEPQLFRGQDTDDTDNHL
jgi:hypothetical protein